MIYKGKVAFCFLVVKNLKNIELWKKYFKGYEDYISIYAHISGPDYDKGTTIFDPILWNNRVESFGVEHTATKWGTASLIKAEGLLYKAALTNKKNKYFCLLSESDIPVISFPEFYKQLNTKNKSYMVFNSARFMDYDVFLDCFPEKYIPSSNNAKSIHERDLRRWRTFTSHQWKILVRRDALEFVKMTKSKTYMQAYDQCFLMDPTRLAPDEYSFINWLSLKYGSDYIRKNVIDRQTTFVDFDEKSGSVHALEYKHITKKLKNMLCEEKPFFARKFLPSDKLLKETPLKC